MPNILANLATELLHQIISYLTFEDFVSLRAAQGHLLDQLHSEEICSQYVKKYIQNSKEGQLAEGGEISYDEAVQRNATRKESFRSARPFSAVVLGYGNTFLYHKGVLCYSRGESLRILNVHQLSQTETVVDFKKMLMQASQHGWIDGDSWDIKRLLDERFAIEILQFQDGVVSCLIASESSCLLLAVDVRPDSLRQDSTQKRLRAAHGGLYPGNILRGPNSRPGMKVMHTSETMYYVCAHHNPYTREGGWAMYFKPFDMTKAAGSPHLRDLFRTWPGQSIVFKIHRGYMYIVSNQSKVAPVLQSGDISDEDDENSYYQSYRFPVDDLEAGPGHSAPSRLEVVRFWRPLPKAEPVDKSSAADLTLQEDESTGELIIVERRQLPISEDTVDDIQSRYDLQPLIFPDLANVDPERDGLQLRLIVGVSRGQIGQSLKTFGQADRCVRRPAHGCPSLGQLETKFQAYNLSCDASVNISYDTKGVNNSAENPGLQGMHIHVGSRKCRGSSRTWVDGNQAAQQTMSETSTDEGRAGDYETHTWPPADAPKQLLEVLNPFPGRDCNISAQSDECSIMYMVGPKDGEWIPKHKEGKFQTGDLVYLKPEAAERMRRKDEEASKDLVDEHRLGDLDDSAETESVEDDEGPDDSNDQVASELSNHNGPLSPTTKAQSMQKLAVDDNSHATSSDTNHKDEHSQLDDGGCCGNPDFSNVVTRDFLDATDSTGDANTDPGHFRKKNDTERKIAENDIIDEGAHMSSKSSKQQVKFEGEQANQTTQDNHADHTRQEDHAIVLINFDAGICLPRPERMHLKSGTSCNKGNAIHVPAVESAQEDIRKGRKPTDDAESVGEVADSEMPWFREERASWLDIGRGLEFAYEDDDEGHRS